MKYFVDIQGVVGVFWEIYKGLDVIAWQLGRHIVCPYGREL
jgi:hypothetical protein